MVVFTSHCWSEPMCEPLPVGVTMCVYVVKEVWGLMNTYCTHSVLDLRPCVLLHESISILLSVPVCVRACACVCPTPPSLRQCCPRSIGV